MVNKKFTFIKNKFTKHNKKFTLVKNKLSNLNFVICLTS